MDKRVLLDDFEEVRECDFKGEHYSVRDNGAILRHSRPGKRLRKNDDVWTFGKPDETNGYMYICNVRVHQIVATAFFGERDTKVYVVDHKDCNRRNNRVDNLHWLTRLENTLSNPSTRKKIIMCCGSVEAFLENPTLIRRFAKQNPNYSWMKTVTKDEAKNTLNNMNEWALRPIEEPIGGSMGEWIYKSLGFNPQMDVMNKMMKNGNLYRHRKIQKPVMNKPSVEEPDNNIINANYPASAVQKNWKTPTDFPLCPVKLSNTALQDYYGQLSKGKILTTNVYGGTMILEYAMNQQNTYIWVLSKRTEHNPVKAWVLTGICVDNGKFVHENLHSFFEEKGGYKYFTLAQGKEWTGGDCFDDYC